MPTDLTSILTRLDRIDQSLGMLANAIQNIPGAQIPDIRTIVHDTLIEFLPTLDAQNNEKLRVVFREEASKIRPRLF